MEDLKELKEFVDYRLQETAKQILTSKSTQSPTIGELAGALAKAQGEIEGAKKDSENPFFKSSYADLASVWTACHKQLSKNNLAVIQTTANTEKGIAVFTTLAHSSGEWIRGELELTPVKSDPQGIGSAITYARRYALAAMVGVAPEDDDGNAASGKNGHHEPTTPAPQRQSKPQTKKAPQNAPSEAKSDLPDDINELYQAALERLQKCRAIPEIEATWSKYIAPIWNRLNSNQTGCLLQTKRTIKEHISQGLADKPADKSKREDLGSKPPEDKKEALNWYKKKITQVFLDLQEVGDYSKEWFDEQLHGMVNSEYKSIFNARMVDLEAKLPEFLMALENEMVAASDNDDNVPF